MATTSRGEELRRVYIKRSEGGRGSQLTKETAGARVDQGMRKTPQIKEELRRTDDQGARQGGGVRRRPDQERDTSQDGQANARGSIGASVQKIPTKFIKYIKHPINPTNQINLNPVGVQRSITDWIQKAKLDRAQSMGNRHQTPKARTTEEDSNNLETGILDPEQESVSTELKDLLSCQVIL